MAQAFTVALVGFSQDESVTFESFFRLAARRPPGYVVQEEILDAQLLIVNADNAQALHLVQYAELPGKVLLIGQHDHGTGWALQQKPVRLVNVLTALDGITGVRRAAPARAPQARPRLEKVDTEAQGFAATQPFEGSALQALEADRRRLQAAAQPPAPMKPAARIGREAAESQFPPTQPWRRDAARRAVADPAATPVAPVAARVTAPTPDQARRLARPGVMGLTDFGGLDDLPGGGPVSLPSRRGPAGSRSSRFRAPAVPEVRRGDALLVAESLVEGRILHKRLSKYGLSVDWSREGAQALAMLKAHTYRLVVIDRLTGDPDAFTVCRQAKACRLPTGLSPAVLMFAPSAGGMDRLKAGLAGSDGYYPRSVPEAELYRVLAEHRLVSLDGFEPTNVGGF